MLEYIIYSKDKWDLFLLGVCVYVCTENCGVKYSS